MPTLMPKKTTPDQELGIGVLLVLSSTVIAIFAAHRLRNGITPSSVGFAMVSIGLAVNGFIRLRYRSVERSWVAHGALLFAAAGLAATWMRVPP